MDDAFSTAQNKQARDHNLPKMNHTLSYKAGQWSPFNKDGKKVYDRDFLLSLRRNPNSNKKPDNLLLDIIATESRTVFSPYGAPMVLQPPSHGYSNDSPRPQTSMVSSTIQPPIMSYSPVEQIPDSPRSEFFKTYEEYLQFKSPYTPPSETAQLASLGSNTIFEKSNMSSPVEEISSDFKLNKVLEEYVNDRFSLQLCLEWIKTNASAIEISQLVFLGSMSVLEKSKISRLQMGVLFAQLIEMKILSISNYCLGLESIFDNSDDPVIDIPKVWMSVAELISPVICDEIVSLKDLHNSFKFLKSSNSHAPELLNCLFKVIIQERSITFLKKTLKNSMLTFTDFMEKSQVNNFVKQNNIAFLHTELNISESLGSIQLFGSWNRGSNVKTQLPPDDEKETEVIDQDSISVKEDVKLHETENAWKPARFIASATMTDDEKKTEELYKKVRGVLNKLTPQKFETLLDQVRSLDIDTTERLQGVVDLVFEKAVDEPSFSVAYALLSREVALMQVPATDAKRKEGQEFVNFRKLLVTRCQLEFEKNSIDETERSRRIKEIEDTEDGEKKKDMQLDLDEYDRRLTMRSVGTVRFIGELFKQQMLTVNVMLRCLNNLLETKDEESLECLCTLLTTVGKALETKKVDLGGIFSAMKDIADKKHGKISNRVRFMIQDVIDLRSSRWIPRRLPRRQDLNPKTMDQIQKEAENEPLTIQAMNSGSMTPRRDERSDGGGGGGGGGGVNSSTDKKRTRNFNDDGWSTAQSRGNTRTPFTVQSDKFKNRTPMMDEPLGSIQMFGSWGRGSESIGTESDKRPALGLRMNNKNPYSSKGPSMERNYRQSFDGRGSQHRSGDSSTASQHNITPAPVPSTPEAQPPTGAAPAPAPVELTPDQLERRLKNILEEYQNYCCSFQECHQDIKTSISPSALPQLVSSGYISGLERSKTARGRTGYLFAQLIKLGTLTLQDYCVGLEAVLEEADELIIDIPKVWEYVAELIAPVLREGSATLKDLHKSIEPLVSKNHASKLLASLFKLIIQEEGPNFLQRCWKSSGFTFADYMAESQVESYIKENNLEFLLEAGDSSSVNHSHSPLLGQKLLLGSDDSQQEHSPTSSNFANKNPEEISELQMDSIVYKSD